jgi:supervillin
MVLSITKDSLDGYNGKAFCKILDRDDDDELISAGHSDEDELIENCLQETNMVYEFEDDSLVPIEDFWGQVMTISIVNSRKIIIFDFGSEMYVWNGKNALPDDKRMALLLAEELFESPFDYTACDLNPINFSTICGNRKMAKREKMNGIKRPNWAFLARVNQNMETILFRQKFADWPDIKIKTKYGISHVDCNEIEHIDGERLYRTWVYEEPNLVLENSCLGRGNCYFDNETRRYFEIITVAVKKWHANSEGNEELPSDKHPHFYATEAYTALWKYQISITVRELSGKVSSRSTVGRDRYVYFNWQGVDATPSEKGTSTLHMVELDKEKGSQMIIQQYAEIPPFVRLFKTMFIHRQRMDESRYDKWRMYLITGGNDASEAIALEVPCEMQQLRSRACVFLVQGRNGQLVLWKGSKTSEQQQKIALSVCSKLCGKKYSEFFATEKIRLREYVEGQESSEFFTAICGDENARATYHSLMERVEAFDFTPRMYELTSKNGSFEAIEVVPGMRNNEHYTAFPFNQSDLYSARQPTLFLVDNGYALYLWQGWWPKNSIEETSQDEVDVNNVENRAGENRWHLERCEAMQTALDYWKAKCGHDDKYRKEAYIVTAGYEPIEFQTIFPEWVVNDEVVEINSQV